MGPLSYFWWSNSNLVKRLFMAPFFRNNLFGSFWMKLISVKKENRFKLTQCQTLDFALVDTRCLIFNFCWYQTFDFVIVDFSLILLHHKTLFCDDYKEKVRRVDSKKIQSFAETANGKSTKDVATKSNLPGSSLHGRKMKKNLWNI